MTFFKILKISVYNWIGGSIGLKSLHVNTSIHITELNPYKNFEFVKLNYVNT